MDTSNNQETQKELTTRFELLPDDIKQVISSSDYQMKLFDIAKKYKLTYEQLGGLEMQTTLVLLGVSDPKDYISDISAQLNKKPEELTGLVEDIKKDVFNPIRQSLMSIYEQPSPAQDYGSDPAAMNANESMMFEKSGVSIEKELPSTTPSANISENRTDMLASIENPAPSTPRVLNETPKSIPSTMPINKSASASIPVPRAPYAGGAPTMEAVKQPIPMTAKPTGDILAGKLGGTFGVPSKETDHSIKNVGAAPAPKSGDSYREPIE